MEDDDREKIRSNLSRLVLRTQWNVKLETCLLTKGVFKPKMIQLIKVKKHISYQIHMCFFSTYLMYLSN